MIYVITILLLIIAYNLFRIYLTLSLRKVLKEELSIEQEKYDENKIELAELLKDKNSTIDKQKQDIQDHINNLKKIELYEKKAMIQN